MGRLRMFRLLLVLIALGVLVIFLVFNPSAMRAGYLAAIATWQYTTFEKEAFIEDRFRDVLEQPFEEVDATVQRWREAGLTTRQYVDVAKEQLLDDPLVDGVFGYDFLRDSLLIYPPDIVPATMRADFHHFLKWRHMIHDNRKDHELPHDLPHDQWRDYSGRVDSVRSVLQKSLGFTQYTYPNKLEPDTLRSRMLFQTFGVFWNKEAYLVELPELCAEAREKSVDWGIKPKFVSELNSWYYGLLLEDGRGDTLFSVGDVEKVRHHNAWRDSVMTIPAHMFIMPKVRFDRMPGWETQVSAHVLSREGNESGESCGPIGVQMASFLYSRFTAQAWQRFQPFYIEAGLAMLILILVILDAIIAQNRQRRLLDYLAHELRTPLANIRLYSEGLLDKRITEPDQQTAYLNTIQNEALHLGATVENILEQSRGRKTGREVLKQVELMPLIQREVVAFTPLLEGAGINIETDLAMIEGIKTKVYPHRLASALRNLLDNVVRHAAGGKEIRIAAGTAENKIRILVEDRGPGIPDAFKRKIFKRFKTLKGSPNPGAGLGLAGAREEMKRMKGRVLVEDREGGGARFIIELEQVS